MTRDEIQQILSDVAGNPDTGAVREIIPGMAAALDEKLNGTDAPATATTGRGSKETRIVAADETR